MLRMLRFKNFKSWKEAKVECAPITGFFGTNSSGKTSLLQFLLMLKQTKDGTDRAISLDLNGDLVQLGTITDVIHKQDESLPLLWALAACRSKDCSSENTQENIFHSTQGELKVQ